MILTHSSRKENLTHTSWAEIFRFKDCLKKFLGLTVRLRSYELLSVGEIDDIMIFCSGKMTNAVKTYAKLAYEKGKKVFCIVQDPNWPTEIRPGCPYVLLTPFASLQVLEAMKAEKRNDCLQKLADELDWDLEDPTDLYYVPFGVMFYALSDLSKYQHIKVLDEKMMKRIFAQKHSMCYIGSFKKDRLHAFQRVAKSGCDFYGHYTEQFLSENGIDTTKSVCKGRIPSDEVITVYSAYQKAAYMSDPKMLALSTNCLRIYEMAQTPVEIELFQLTKSDQKKAIQILKCFDQKPEETFTELFYNEKDLIDILNRAKQPWKCYEDNVLRDDLREFKDVLYRIGDLL